MRFGISTMDGIFPKSFRVRRPHCIIPAIRPPESGRACPTLLDLDGGPHLFELLLHLLGLRLRDLLLAGLWSLVHHGLRLLEAEPSHLANDFDDLDLLVPGRGEEHVELGPLLLRRRGRGARSGCPTCGGHGHRRHRRDAVLVLQPLDEAVQVQHGPGINRFQDIVNAYLGHCRFLLGSNYEADASFLARTRSSRDAWDRSIPSSVPTRRTSGAWSAPTARPSSTSRDGSSAIARSSGG